MRRDIGADRACGIQHMRPHSTRRLLAIALRDSDHDALMFVARAGDAIASNQTSTASANANFLMNPPIVNRSEITCGGSIRQPTRRSFGRPHLRNLYEDSAVCLLYLN